MFLLYPVQWEYDDFNFGSILCFLCYDEINFRFFMCLLMTYKTSLSILLLNKYSRHMSLKVPFCGVFMKAVSKIQNRFSNILFFTETIFTNYLYIWMCPELARNRLFNICVLRFDWLKYLKLSIRSWSLIINKVHISMNRYDLEILSQ